MTRLESHTMQDENKLKEHLRCFDVLISLTMDCCISCTRAFLKTKF